MQGGEASRVADRYIARNGSVPVQARLLEAPTILEQIVADTELLFPSEEYAERADMDAPS